MAKEEKNPWVVKSAIGSLFKAVTLSTDPAMTLGYEASLINTTRAALIQKLEERVPDAMQIPIVMKEVLLLIMSNWKTDNLDDEGYDLMDKRICSIFKDTSMARYGLEIYRDILFVEQLHSMWHQANQYYIQSPASWAQSNAILAQVNKQLLEIIVRHELMTFPKGDVFNMDRDSGSMGAIMKRLQDEKGEA